MLLRLPAVGHESHAQARAAVYASLVIFLFLK